MRHRHDDEEEVLQDGQIGRCSLKMRDAVKPPAPRGRIHLRGLLDTVPPLVLSDGNGNVPGNRPGFVTSNDAAMRDAKQQAHDAYLHELTNAWRRGPVRDARKVTQRDPSGRLMATFEEEPDDDELYDASTLTLDEVMRDHQERMAEVYTAYDKALGERWRQP